MGLTNAVVVGHALLTARVLLSDLGDGKQDVSNITHFQISLSNIPIFHRIVLIRKKFSKILNEQI